MAMEWMDIIVAEATGSLLWQSTTFTDSLVKSAVPLPSPSTLPNIYDLGYESPVAAIYRHIEYARLIGFDQLDDPKAFSEVSLKLWSIYSKLDDDERTCFLYLGFIHICRVNL